ARIGRCRSHRSFVGAPRRLGQSPWRMRRVPRGSSQQLSQDEEDIRRLTEQRVVKRRQDGRRYLSLEVEKGVCGHDVNFRKGPYGTKAISSSVSCLHRVSIARNCARPCTRAGSRSCSCSSTMLPTYSSSARWSSGLMTRSPFRSVRAGPPHGPVHGLRSRPLLRWLFLRWSQRRRRAAAEYRRRGFGERL